MYIIHSLKLTVRPLKHLPKIYRVLNGKPQLLLIYRKKQHITISPAWMSQEVSNRLVQLQYTPFVSRWNNPTDPNITIAPLSSCPGISSVIIQVLAPWIIKAAQNLEFHQLFRSGTRPVTICGGWLFPKHGKTSFFKVTLNWFPKWVTNKPWKGHLWVLSRGKSATLMSFFAPPWLANKISKKSDARE